jgi:hypothetical protein
MLAFKLESMVYLKLRDYSFKARMLAKNYITSKKIKIPNEKIKLIDNTTDDEFERVNKICDIFSAIGDAAIDVVSPPEGGLFWSFAKKGMGPFDLYTRKSREEINHSFLFNTRFRDFPAIAYEMDEITPKMDFWARKYVRLIKHVSRKWQVRVPARFGEIGWNVNNYPVNRLTSINQERINVMQLMGVTKYLEEQKKPKILEIGAGGGELGYVLCKALPECTWFDCDLLGSLAYSAIHLSILLPEKKHYIYVGNLNLPDHLDQRYIIRSALEAANLENAVINIPNFLVDDFVGKLDLHFAYNTYSFGEMPVEAVTHYISLLSGFLKEKGILFEQNGDFSTQGGHDIKKILQDKFSQVGWPKGYNEPNILNGVSQLWCNNQIGKRLPDLVKSFFIFTILQSFQDNDDTVDIEYPVDCWHKIHNMFPLCV